MEIDQLINSIGGRDAGSEVPAFRVLTRAWIAERMCPELLPFERNIVEIVVSQIRELINYIDMQSLEISQNPEIPDIKMVLLIVESQLERFKFLVRSYLRTRIAKIDKYLPFYANPENESRLSPSEIEYTQRHLDLLQNLYNTSFFNQWPPQFSDIRDPSNPDKVVDPPPLDKPVAVKLTNDAAVGGYQMEKGDMMIAKYHEVREMLGTDIDLI